MAIKTARVTLSTTPTRLTVPDTDSQIGQAVVAQAPVDMYVGGPDVTAANGFLVAANVPFSLDLGGYDILWGVLASGSTVVSVLQQGA